MSEPTKKPAVKKTSKEAPAKPAAPAPPKPAAPPPDPSKPAVDKPGAHKQAAPPPPPRAPPNPPPPPPAPPKPTTPPPAPPKPRHKVELREGWLLKEAAEAMKVRPKDLLDKLAAKGFKADLEEFIDAELAAVITKVTNFDAEFITPDLAMRRKAEGRTAGLAPRSPVVTIIGHVDPR